MNGAADLLVVGAQKARSLRSGEDTAMGTGERDPFGSAARTAHGLQRPVVSPEMGNHPGSVAPCGLALRVPGGLRTASGAELFTLDFAMPDVAEGDGGSSFAFVLPVEPGWADNLASITLSGPGGSARLDADSDIPMSILLDRSAGQVRGILRDVLQADAAAALAPQAGVDSLDTLFSRGIPDAALWDR